MTVTAYQSGLEQISGYFRTGLDGIPLGVSQTRFVAKEVSLEIETIGVADADLKYYLCFWIAEITFNTIFSNTSKLRASVQKYTLGYWDMDYWGTVTSSGYLQYLSQRLPLQYCWLSRDAYVYPSLVFPYVQGLSYEIASLSYSSRMDVPSATTLHYLIDQANPIGASLQIQYVCYKSAFLTTPPYSFTEF